MSRSIQVNEAQNYEDISSIENKDGLNLIDLAYPKQGDKVLDLGCGTGYLSNVLAGLVGSQGLVVAIDPDADRLDLAKTRYKASNLQFLKGTAENFPGDSYDLIISNHVLHWVQNRPAVFAKLANSVKSGGKIACTYPVEHSYNGDKLDFLSAPYRQKISASDPVGLGECDVLTDVYDFQLLHSSQHNCVHTFENAEGYIKFFLTHLKCEEIEEKDIDIEVLHKRKERLGGYYFKYPILTIVMQKN